MILTIEEIRLIQRELGELGPEYSKVPEIAKLQAKLSIMLEAKLRVEDMEANNYGLDYSEMHNKTDV